ncbi:hypothetical protein [Sphingobium aromaticiconvertens]|uniref:hypothetical protein n=1 Tax=Sphingobium aromaticiconvertens TaxID=365341 RepID=UPI003017D307
MVRKIGRRLSERNDAISRRADWIGLDWIGLDWIGLDRHARMHSGQHPAAKRTSPWESRRKTDQMINVSYNAARKGGALAD